MVTQLETMFARQLEERKARLQQAISESGEPDQLRELLRDVDRALEKMSHGVYGLCETCTEPIESERLSLDPLTRFCVDHLSEKEQLALERDLELARQIQTGLLPKRDLVLPGWTSAYHYQPLGHVSGDYCDLIVSAEKPGSFFFIVGDVAGKGIAASMLMSQLHAMFRTLAWTGLSLADMMERANRLFCEASLTTHFATLVCGIAESDGKVQVSNAGHCLPLVVRGGGIEKLQPSGLPLGIACNSTYGVEYTRLNSGDGILLYTDGLTEASNDSGELYGEGRISRLLTSRTGVHPSGIISSIVADVSLFSGDRTRTDDMTLIMIRKA